MSFKQALLLFVAAQTISCGREVQRPETIADAPRVSRRIEAQDLLPSDLDVVLRFDVARMASELGPAAMDELRRGALRSAAHEGDPLASWLADALGGADVVWVATRLGAFETGDRVIVVEGKVPAWKPGVLQLTKLDTGFSDVAVLDRSGSLKRSDLARVVLHKDRLAAFVSAVEVDAVLRSLRGQDTHTKLDPPAEGLLSAEAKISGLPEPYAGQYPSLARLTRHIEKASLVVTAKDKALQLEGQLVANTVEGAELVEKLLTALRDEGGEGGEESPLKGAEFVRVERVVRVRWVIGWGVLQGLWGTAGG